MDSDAFAKVFPDEAACQRWLEARRWPHGPTCPRCGSVNEAVQIRRARYWRCRACKKDFAAVHGTPMEGTHLPLCTWLRAAYLIGGSDKTISAMRLAADLGVSYKSAWVLRHRLKQCLADPQFILHGVGKEVEAA